MEQIELLKLAVKSLERLQIPYAIVGSYASSVWGESRFTQDIDIVVGLNSADVELLCREFPAPAFYVSQSAASDAVAQGGQFNVIHPSSGNKIDFMIAGQNSWAASQLQRAQKLSIFPDFDVWFATPEDVILGKLAYYQKGGSEKHLRDIAGILKISGELVDRQYIEQFSKQLGVAEYWQAILQRVEPTAKN